VDVKESRGKRQFKIHWKGYGPDSDTWENEEDLSCPNIIKSFLEENERKAKKRAGKGANNRIPKKTTEGGKGDVVAEKEDDNKEYEVSNLKENL